MSYKNLLVCVFAVGLGLSATFANAFDKVPNRCICRVTVDPRACFVNGCNSWLEVDLIYNNPVTGQIETKRLVDGMIGRGMPPEETRRACNQQLQQLTGICEVMPVSEGS